MLDSMMTIDDSFISLNVTAEFHLTIKYFQYKSTVYPNVDNKMKEIVSVDDVTLIYLGLDKEEVLTVWLSEPYTALF